MAGEVCAKTVQGDSSVEFGRREHTNLVAKANVLQVESPDSAQVATGRAEPWSTRAYEQCVIVLDQDVVIVV